MTGPPVEARYDRKGKTEEVEILLQQVRLALDDVENSAQGLNEAIAHLEDYLDEEDDGIS
jgi:hypothetical protein